MTPRQCAVSRALDAYATAQRTDDVARAIHYRAKILELVEMRQTDSFPISFLEERTP